MSVQVGDATILPGECALGPRDERGGAIEVGVTDGRGGGRRQQWVFAPRGKTTVVIVGRDAELEVERDRCDQRASDWPT